MIAHSVAPKPVARYIKTNSVLKPKAQALIKKLPKNTPGQMRLPNKSIVASAMQAGGRTGPAQLGGTARDNPRKPNSTYAAATIPTRNRYFTK